MNLTIWEATMTINRHSTNWDMIDWSLAIIFKKSWHWDELIKWLTNSGEISRRCTIYSHPVGHCTKCIKHFVYQNACLYWYVYMDIQYVRALYYPYIYIYIYHHTFRLCHLLEGYICHWSAISPWHISFPRCPTIKQYKSVQSGTKRVKMK